MTRNSTAKDEHWQASTRLEPACHTGKPGLGLTTACTISTSHFTTAGGGGQSAGLRIFYELTAREARHSPKSAWRTSGIPFDSCYDLVVSWPRRNRPGQPGKALNIFQSGEFHLGGGGAWCGADHTAHWLQARCRPAGL
jgi:hypothetical protein